MMDNGQLNKFSLQPNKWDIRQVTCWTTENIGKMRFVGNLLERWGVRLGCQTNDMHPKENLIKKKLFPLLKSDFSLV